MKKRSCLFAAIAIVLSDVMCFVVAYSYRDMLCGVEHAGYSAPAYLAFLNALPFLACIVLCVALVFKLYKKAS